jgi:hypothetical protein
LDGLEVVAHVKKEGLSFVVLWKVQRLPTEMLEYGRVKHTL